MYKKIYKRNAFSGLTKVTITRQRQYYLPCGLDLLTLQKYGVQFKNDVYIDLKILDNPENVYDQNKVSKNKNIFIEHILIKFF